MDYKGEISALIASIAWAGANYAFQSNMGVFSPMMLNFAKCMISSIFILISLYIFDIPLFPLDDFSPYISLTLSGIFGIAIGDSLFLAALNELGARKTLLLETLAPPMTGLIAYVYYGTTIPLLGWIGVLLTLYGLYVVVVVEKSPSQETKQEQSSHLSQEALLIQMTSISDLSPIPETQFHKIPAESDQSAETGSNNQRNKSIFSPGVIYGAASMFFSSLGLVLSSSVLSTGAFNPLSTTLIRIAPQNLILYPILKYYRKESFSWPRLSRSSNLSLIATILVSTVFCISMQQLSLVYTRPEISQTLIAISPLFALAIGRFKGEHITMKQTIGSFISVFGVILIIQV